MNDQIHSCSYYCHIPACIKAQRDELRDKFVATSDTHRVVSVELLARAAGMLGKTMYNAGPEVAEQLRAIIANKGAT